MSEGWDYDDLDCEEESDIIIIKKEEEEEENDKDIPIGFPILFDL
jgi:hypothetical protein